MVAPSNISISTADQSIDEVRQEEEVPSSMSATEISQRLHDSLEAWRELSGLSKEIGKFALKARVAVAKETSCRDHMQDITRNAKKRRLHKADAAATDDDITKLSLSQGFASTTQPPPTAADVRKVQRMANVCQHFLAAQKMFEKEILASLEEAEDLELSADSGDDATSSAE